MKKIICLSLLIFCVILVACMEDKRSANNESSSTPNTTATNDVQNNESIDQSMTDDPSTVLSVDESSPEDSSGQTQNTEVTVQQEKIQEQLKQAADNVEAQPQPQYAQPENQEQNESSLDSLGISTWDLIAVSLGLLGLFLALYVLYKYIVFYKEAYDKFDAIDKEKEEARMEANREFINLQREKSTDIIKIQSKLNSLEESLKSEIKRLQKPIVDIKHEHDNTPNNPPIDKSTNRGYFGVVKVTTNGTALFNDYPEFNDGSAYFKVHYLDDGINCEFAPISLDKIRSVDVIINNAIEYSGCPMGYARDMKITSWGKAQKDSANNCWILKEKVKIELKP